MLTCSQKTVTTLPHYCAVLLVLGACPKLPLPNLMMRQARAARGQLRTRGCAAAALRALRLNPTPHIHRLAILPLLASLWLPLQLALLPCRHHARCPLAGTSSLAWRLAWRWT